MIAKHVNRIKYSTLQSSTEVDKIHAICITYAKLVRSVLIVQSCFCQLNLNMLQNIMIEYDINCPKFILTFDIMTSCALQKQDTLSPLRCGKLDFATNKS